MKILNRAKYQKSENSKEEVMLKTLQDLSAKQAIATGSDQASMWYQQIRSLQDHSGDNIESQEDFREWVMSQPLGKIAISSHEESLDGKLSRLTEKEKCTVSEVFESIKNGAITHSFGAYLSSFCVATYKSKEEARRFVREQGGEGFCWFHDKITSSTGFGCVIHGHPVICFRGTKTLRQLFLDCLVLPYGFTIRHMGFVIAWRRLKKQVLAWLENLDQAQGVVLTGHSLGGAMAFLAAYELCSSDYDVSGVATFGAPRVGMTGFKKKYSLMRNSGKNKSVDYPAAVTYRYTNKTDIVSKLPPPILFKHVVQPDCMIGEDGMVEPKYPKSYIQRIELIVTKHLWRWGRSRGYGITSSTDEARGLALPFMMNNVYWGGWLIIFLLSFFLIAFVPLILLDFYRHNMDEGYADAFRLHYLVSKE